MWTCRKFAFFAFIIITRCKALGVFDDISAPKFEKIKNIFKSILYFFPDVISSLKCLQQFRIFNTMSLMWVISFCFVVKLHYFLTNCNYEYFFIK